MVRMLKQIVRDWKRFLIGFSISSFWFLIIPYFIALGYIDRVIQSRKYKIEELPRWVHFGNLVIRGSRLFLIFIAYTFIPLLISIMGSRGVTISSPISLLAIIGGVLYIVSSFFIPGAIFMYTENENSLLGAFKFVDIIKLMFTFPKKYIKAYLLWIFLSFISFLTIAIPVIGFFVMGGVNFFVNLICFVMFSEIGGAKVEESEGFQYQEEYEY